ncbi:hypothetical protein [Streptomyces sp. NBC_01601]|uniref:hypothetical protein n=1 Tax=Streptomyces sp. NBC_01601 TaxID=2975892 RepID=UPI002E2E01CA|nr:hypothetical protein [Streptomyces sp. NBC_01601]
MPQHLAIACPKCPSEEAEVHLDPRADELSPVTAFSCRLCGHRWRPTEVPYLFAPDYDQAYADAPPLPEEELTLALWAEGINLRARAAHEGNGSAIDPGGYRLFYLRQAAYLDRTAHALAAAAQSGLTRHQHVADAVDAAVMAADLLLHFDLELGQVHVEGALGADSSQWQTSDGLRAYVRQEYTAWQDWETTTRRNRHP